MRELLAFYLPLALTHMMMAGGTPIVNAGITRLSNPTEQLAAFAVTFSLSVLLNSFCFGIEPAAVKLIRGGSSFGRVIRFALLIGSVLAGLELIVALSPLSELIFEGLFGLTPSVARHSAHTLLVFSPLPILLSLRSVAKGTLTASNLTAKVGWGTLLRLTAMLIIVLIGVLFLPLPGAVLGGLAFLGGILVESVYTTRFATKNLHRLPGDESGEAGESYRSILHFLLPIILSTAIGVSVNISTNAILSRTQDSVVAVSAFSVVRSIAWFLTSVLLSYQQFVIARSSIDERPYVWRFSATGIVVISSLLGIIAYSPAGDFIMTVLLGVRGDVLLSASYGLLWIPVLPVLMGARSYLRGTAIRDNHPRDVLFSSTTSLIFGTAVGLVLCKIVSEGILAGLAVWYTATLAEIVVIAWFRYSRRKTVY